MAAANLSLSHSSYSSPSSTCYSSSPFHRCLLPRSPLTFLSRKSLRFGFCSETPRILTFRSQVRNLGPGASSSDSNGDGFGSNLSMNLGENDASIASSVSASPACSAIDFLTLCHRLKTTKRKGWLNHGIKGPESIADHMYRMALMALIIGDLPGVNRERCIKIAIVHDIAEVGDITPSDGVPKKEKSRREQAALDEMCEVLGGGLRAEEIKELWAEYENNASLEANLVKDFDKVEMILQALEYEMEHGKVLDEFFLSTAGKFQTEVGKKWAAEITRRRNSRLGNR
ncbi:5'-deoxynucleotidase hdd1 isoform X2 [Macadamia integrifolia]|uniref:5'-deoxynucleotidase hdd1 isoform X2 n=1 Tax=Macadamia integrifolia TaxID=60698 RepID=UPI001C4E8895|nr:5'-deoxynucleotidase hdd1 isoform X2 [Macadamia integrifolia]